MVKAGELFGMEGKLTVGIRIVTMSLAKNR
jgi:hypothetical protein